MTLLTQPAEEAIRWLRQQLPGVKHDYFMWDLENALRDVLRHYGVNEEVIETFNVERFIALQDAAESVPTTKLLAFIFVSEDNDFAISASGTVYRKRSAYLWQQTELEESRIRLHARYQGQQLIDVLSDEQHASAPSSIRASNVVNIQRGCKQLSAKS